MPSYPATEMSSGTRSPAAAMVFSPPMAEKSSGNRMQVGGWGSASSAVALYRRQDAFAYVRPQLLYAAMGLAAM